ncbi:putative Cysteine-rich RLK (RECEPTOR-like protein kinase) 25 [Tripterygium wilfordii]|uniref:Putative Cysteine-rich RLK (RECEPTOR-like protein kinase) 25 n=1 Tax=Tripterygium wilfordii TaxID=458696 RepID=A0A7J7C4Z3_TRIWF|nr:putative Cysteine-rich RLK (RECEPTOR-like protein kinase) 25 [Tripterygium wilfordii]
MFLFETESLIYSVSGCATRLKIDCFEIVIRQVPVQSSVCAGKENNTSRTIIIIVVPIVSVLVLILCIWIYLRQRKRKPKKTDERKLSTIFFLLFFFCVFLSDMNQKNMTF